jgi:hypothetical protein
MTQQPRKDSLPGCNFLFEIMMKMMAIVKMIIVVEMVVC